MSRNYATTDAIDIGNQTTYTYQNLQEGQTYFFVVTAYNTSGKESEYSNEVFYKVPVPNNAPKANSATLSVIEDTPAEGTLSGTDVDGHALTYALASTGSKGTATLTDPSTGTYTYTPQPNATGSDTFTFRVSDGEADSTTATVTVMIAAVNDPPMAKNDAATLQEDMTVSVNVLANDEDIDDATLTVSGVTQGAHGTVAVNSPNVVYTPAANFHGTDTFTYMVSDGKGGTATARVTLAVDPVNDAPKAVNGTLSLMENTPAEGTLSGTDVDGHALTYALASTGSKGTATLTDPSTGTYTYTPQPNATGSDTFTFRVSDGEADSTTATVTVTINPSVTICLEAEEGVLSEPMIAALDTKAFNGGYIWVPSRTGNVTDPSISGGTAEYTFEIPVSGNYVIWAHAMANSTADNSFFISVDYEPFTVWNTALGAKDSWIWDQVGPVPGSPAPPLALEEGIHTLIVKHREDGTRLDKIVITSDPKYFMSTTYSDAEQGTTSGWRVQDADPVGTQIMNVFDETRQSNVIELIGSGTDNSCQLLTEELTSWANTTQRVAQWSMRYSENCSFTFAVETSDGLRYLVYRPTNTDTLTDTNTLYFGIGTSTIGGHWHSIVRDLQADLTLAQPATRILKVLSLTVAGSGAVDDISLR